MITRGQALAHSPRAVCLVLLAAPWVLAIPWNAWDQRAAIVQWLRDQRG